MSTRFALPTLYALGLLAACGGEASPTMVGELEQPILHGARSVEADNSVVYIFSDLPGDEAAACTGTLIAPNLVATALHCVTSAVLGTFECKPDGSIEAANVRDGTIGPLLPVEAVRVHVGLQVPAAPTATARRLFGTDSTQICRNDFALIVLDREVDAPVAPIRLDGKVRWGDEVRVLGYGQTETNDSGGYRYVREGVRVLDVGPSSDAEPTGTAAPRTFVVDEGPCDGDSGGPAFDSETGALLGVYSLNAAPTCDALGVRNVYTAIQPFSELILEAFDEAGHEPVLEATGEAPAAPSDDGGCTLSSGRRAAGAAHLPWGAAAVLALGMSLVARRRRR